MNTKSKLEILPEDKVKLTNDQKNLIELAFAKQVPPEDAEFMEKAQREAKRGEDPFTKLSEYFCGKYGLDFGLIYLSAIMGGEEKYKETVESIEQIKAFNRTQEN